MSNLFYSRVNRVFIVTPRQTANQGALPKSSTYPFPHECGGIRVFLLLDGLPSLLWRGPIYTINNKTKSVNKFSAYLVIHSSNLHTIPLLFHFLFLYFMKPPHPPTTTTATTTHHPPKDHWALHKTWNFKDMYLLLYLLLYLQISGR